MSNTPASSQANPLTQRLINPPTLLFLWSVILTLLVYGRSLNLPFFFDDLDHMPFVSRTSLIDIWRSSGGFPYYRPLAATIWRLSYLLWGESHSVTLHAINLILHALNGWLVALLFQQLTKKKLLTWSILITALFIVYPFSYQAVPWIGALYHILAITLVLGALVLFGANGRFATPFSLLCTFLAPFAHENGIIIWPLIMLLVIFGQDHLSWKKRFTTGLLWLTPVLAWATIWAIAPKARGDGLAINHAEAIWQNSAYFLQGLAYPITWIGGWLRDDWGANDLGTAVTLSLLILLPTLSITYKRKPIWFALALYAVSSLPAILLLDFAYVISSPRLLALPSVGIVLFWGITFQALWQRVAHQNEQRQWVSQAALVMIILVVISQNLAFVQQHMRQHQWLGSIWWEAADQAIQAEANNQVATFINLPSSLTMPNATYPLGHEGTVFMVSYIPLDRILPVQTNRAVLPYQLRRQEDIRPQLSYIYDVMGDGRDWPQLVSETPSLKIYATLYDEPQITLQYVGQTDPPIAEPTSGHFPDLGLTLSHTRPTIKDGHITIPLIWHSQQQNGAEWTIFVHILNEKGELIAQADGQAWQNSYPLTQWPLDLAIEDVRSAQLPDDYTQIQINVGLYNSVTGERATAVTPNNITADHLVLQKIDKDER